MTLALWNIDQPAAGTARFAAILTYLRELNSDHLVLTETNAALRLPGYAVRLSLPSPFTNRSRNSRPPNRYHQVGVYSRAPLQRAAGVADINGAYAAVASPIPLHLYGSVFTIKDRWASWSSLRYSDRVEEQCAIIRQLSGPRFIACGDFNFRGQGSYHRAGREQLAAVVSELRLVWPTRDEVGTVQHLVHSPDVGVSRYELVPTELSDHPLVLFDL